MAAQVEREVPDKAQQIRGIADRVGRSSSGSSPEYELPPEISLLLIPDNMKLTELTGDDWNDRPANCNASGADSPAGVYVQFTVGQKVPDYVAKALRRWEQEIEEGGG